MYSLQSTHHSIHHVSRIFNIVAAAACAVATAFAPAQASSPAADPTPPRDAKKIVSSIRSGALKMADADPEVVAKQKSQDFDAITTFTNPGVARWFYGIEFRRVENSSAAFIIFSDGTGVMVMQPAGQEMVPIKPPAPIASLRKNANEKNEVAVYARNNQVLVFVNKKYVDTYTVDLLQSGEITVFGDSFNKEETGEIKFSTFIVRVPPGAATSAVAPKPKTPTGNIVITQQNVGYVQWGRPAGMDDPKAGCNSFNDSRPVRQFQLSVQIQNKGSAPVKGADLIFTKTGGAPAFWCFYNYDGAFLEIAPGQARNITFAVFVELNEAVESFFIVDPVLGESNRLRF
jgi:hypothetical protein